MFAVSLIRGSDGGAIGVSAGLRWSFRVSTTCPAFGRAANVTELLIVRTDRSAWHCATYDVATGSPFFSARPSVGEVLVADLLTLDAAGVSKGALRFDAPLVAGGSRRAFGVRSSSLKLL